MVVDDGGGPVTCCGRVGGANGSRGGKGGKGGGAVFAEGKTAAQLTQKGEPGEFINPQLLHSPSGSIVVVGVDVGGGGMDCGNDSVSGGGGGASETVADGPKTTPHSSQYSEPGKFLVPQLGQVVASVQPVGSGIGGSGIEAGSDGDCGAKWGACGVDTRRGDPHMAQTIALS